MDEILILQWLQILLFITAVAIALFSLKIARKSLRESEKARRDTFLPIVLITGLHSITGEGSHLEGNIDFKNFGHGTAFNVKAHIPGTEVVDLETKGVADGDGRRYLPYGLPNSDILNNSVITVTYNDIFGRNVKTLHEVNVVASYDNDRHLLQLKNVPPEINLP
ncbi:hypothetical protein ES705_19066 [subsurface metagenome]